MLLTIFHIDGFVNNAFYVKREKLIYMLTNQLDTAYSEINGVSDGAVPHYGPSCLPDYSELKTAVSRTRYFIQELSIIKFLFSFLSDINFGSANRNTRFQELFEGKN